MSSPPVDKRAPQPPPPPFLPPDERFRVQFNKQQVKIQAFLFGTFVLYSTILVLGRLRYRGNGSMKSCSTYLFMGGAYLISYIPGLMNQTSQANDLYALWIAFMAYLAAVANATSCYTLGDNQDRKKRLIVDYSVAWPLIVASVYNNLASPIILVPVVVIFWIIVLKLRERSRALSFATNSSCGLAKATKVISDFDKFQKEELDPSGMSYKYLVGVREAYRSTRKLPTKMAIMTFDSHKDKVITLDKILGTKEGYLGRTGEGNELKQTCFSFAMFWLLLAKIAGYDQVHAQILKNEEYLHSLSGPNNNNEEEHLFRLIEKELEFLYEYLYTNYYASYYRGLWKRLRDVCVVVLFLWLTLPLLVEYRVQDYNLVYVVLWGSVLDIGFSRFVILAIITIELTQMGMFLTSKWAKVMYTCAYLKRQHLWGTKTGYLLETAIGFACHIRIPRPNLSCLNMMKLGQYSILKCYDKIPIPLWAKCWIGAYYEVPRIGQSGSWFTKVTPDLKAAIVASLKYHHRKITNGHASLIDNNVGVDIISKYVKKPESQARCILIWHIATSLIEEEALGNSPSSKYSKDFQVATTFSKYCAYLVAFVPQMLSDHVYTTRCEFDEVVRELQKENGGGGDHPVSILDDEDPKALHGEDSTVTQGRKLQELLKEQIKDQSNLWKTLADFWTEMLLFLALSDHSEAIEAHANSLCVGGEFITHLWALVLHEGCSKMTLSSDDQNVMFQDI